MSASKAPGVDPFISRRATRRFRSPRRRILYVDDDALMRSAAARVLRSAGAVFLGASTHAQVTALLGIESPLDLAILDFQMSDGDPGSLARRLRGQWPSLLVVGTSGSDRRADFAACGVDRFLPKPWTLEDLIEVAGWPEARGDELPPLRG